MLVGHQKQLEFLRSSFAADKASHAYLFCGPDKLGKKTLALSFLAEILRKENHPDLLLVNPEEGEIKISQIRDLIWRLSLKPYLADFKAAVIDDAHLMNQEAQNCFLKTLEEPRGKVFIFLITCQPESLLKTIVSRTQIIKFYPVSRKEIKSFLKSAPAESAEEILRLSFGRPGIAADFVLDPFKIDSFKKSLEDIKRISAADICVRFQYAKEIAEDTSRALNELDVWQTYFRALLLAGAQKDKSQRKYNLLKLKNIIDNIQQTRMLISNTNVNVRLALENLLMEI